MQPDETCWTLIQAAAHGAAYERDAFARRYYAPVEAYLGARWSGNRLLQERDDAVQEVFFEFFRQGGVLERTVRGAPGGFRALLYGVARNVARRVETAQARAREHPPESALNLDAVERDEATLSGAFDRAWALSLMREALELQTRRAQDAGQQAVRRIDLLRLKFEENLPVRAIAERWGAERSAVHEEYRRARGEFKQALFDVVSFHHPDDPRNAEKECAQLLELLAG